jgi:hypothetical protein
MATVVFKKILCISIVYKFTTHCRKKERTGLPGSRKIFGILFCLDSLRHTSKKKGQGVVILQEKKPKKRRIDAKPHVIP